ncbi:hypothetical protein SFGR64A_32290 (plasmid) [Sinorhizobium fredii GR64]|nr:hypothetical protein [Sinorhizobium fredii]WOS67337.1 hypothetical protein SFGR64A_32290 [Sinorhizobium fredii GR64]
MPHVEARPFRPHEDKQTCGLNDGLDGGDPPLGRSARRICANAAPVESSKNINPKRENRKSNAP